MRGCVRLLPPSPGAEGRGKRGSPSASAAATHAAVRATAGVHATAGYLSGGVRAKWARMALLSGGERRTKRVPMTFWMCCHNLSGKSLVMFIPEFGKTFAQLPTEVKNAHSHRGRAAAAMVALMRERWL